MCEAKEHSLDKESVPGRKKGELAYKVGHLQKNQSVRDSPTTPGNLAKVLASAAFPDGLPQEVLGASVATHSTDLPPPMEFTTPVCHCKDGADCHCSNAKKASQLKLKDAAAPPLISSTSPTNGSVPPSIHALRPVLPRPVPQSPSNEHVASQFHPHNHRFSHGSAFFSPYGRAYEEYHNSSEEGHPDSLSENGPATHQSLDLMAWSSDSSGHSFSQRTFPPSSFPDFQDELDSPEFPAGFRGSCTCGKTCACPTCLQHRGPTAWTSREACSNPGSCNGCFHLSEVPPHPAPTPPTTPQDGRQQFEPLEEWIKSIPMIPPSFEDAPKQDLADYSMLDLPRIVEPMPITLDSLPDVFHEPTSQCICTPDQRMRFGDYCMRCQRRCDDHEPGGDLLSTDLSGDRARCVSSNVHMLDVPPPRSRASSTSSVASDISSLYPPSIEDTNGPPTGSLIPPSLSRVRRLTSDITSPPMGDGVGSTYALPYHSSAPDLAHPSSDSYDAYSGPISVLF